MIVDKFNVGSDAARFLTPTREHARKIAKAALLSMAEGAIDMVLDMPEDYTSKEDIDRLFNEHLKQMTADYILDVMNDLKFLVQEELAELQYTAKVRAIKYDEHGAMADVDVEVAED